MAASAEPRQVPLPLSSARTRPSIRGANVPSRCPRARIFLRDRTYLGTMYIPRSCALQTFPATVYPVQYAFPGCTRRSFPAGRNLPVSPMDRYTPCLPLKTSVSPYLYGTYPAQHVPFLVGPCPSRALHCVAVHFTRSSLKPCPCEALPSLPRFFPCIPLRVFPRVFPCLPLLFPCLPS